MAAVRPFSMDPPLSDPTIVRPNIPTMNISGELKERIKGIIRGNETAKATALNTPPNADTEKAAPKARAA